MNKKINVVCPVNVSMTDLVNILRVTTKQLETMQDELLKQLREKEMKQRLLDSIEKRRAINLAVWEHEQNFACIPVNPLFML